MLDLPELFAKEQGNRGHFDQSGIPPAFEVLNLQKPKHLTPLLLLSPPGHTTSTTSGLPAAQPLGSSPPQQ